MNEQNENMVLLAPLVTVNCKHTFGDEEMLQKSQQIADLFSDINHEEEEKKAVDAQYKNKIDTLKAEVKLLSEHITNGFMFTDKPAAMFLDYITNHRVYLSKEDDSVLKTEPFHPSDYQKNLDFDAEETGRQEQIAENNNVGSYTNAPLDENGMYRDTYGNLTDIPPRDTIFDPVDEIIIDKKVKGAKVAKLKPTPKDVLPDNYGKDFEQEDELPEI